ncbi:substrate-binding domain-containing protein [Roseomonas elaeocarpi]|uniref:Substrate-binding domain-containing protein n=1 Tax=Roseomonas elaeocarpi TaxID=907779 RepID=A0ABV6JP32_9PROT
MGRQGIGIRDLARHLGLAVSTVSRAMNDRGDVSAATRKLVRDAALTLGYVPDQSGRSLRQGTTNTIALTMRTDISRTAAGETFFLALCGGLQPVLAAHDLDLVILPCGSVEEQERSLRRAVERRLADGFIISDTQRHDSRIDFLIERGVPFVALGRSLSGGAHAWLDLDFAGVATQAVEHLAMLGHRRIALGTTLRDVNHGHVFLEAYQAALRHHGLPDDPALVLRVADTLEGSRDLADMLLAMPKPATAVILIQETMAIGLYERLGQAGLRPGRDLAVIGFRENQVVAHLDPALTCFRFSLREYGARLGEIMVGRIKAADPSRPPVQELWPMTLRPGGSDMRFDVEASVPHLRRDAAG